MPTNPCANTPLPPYYAVIFTNQLAGKLPQYELTAQRMLSLAAQQPGYLGVEVARDASCGITVSYWSNLEAIAAWKANAEHQRAQAQGRELWYSHYSIRIARVERDYSFSQ